MQTADKLIISGFIVCVVSNILLMFVAESLYIERMFDAIYISLIFYGAGMKNSENSITEGKK